MYFHLGVAMLPLFVARDLLADYMVICHPGEVELDPLDFKLTTITLQDDPDSNLRHSIGLRPTFISTPPLSIHLLPIGLDTWLCNGRGDSPSYELHASTTANAGSFTAPSYLSMLDLYWLSPCRTVTTIRTGVLCFVPAEGAKAPSKYGFLVVLSVQLSQVPPWPRWITAGSMASGEPDLETLWWNEGTPLLHIFPYSALDADLRSGLEVLERGMAKGELSRLLQEHLVTLDDLFGETRDSECACWITGDRRHHVNYDAIQKCKQKAMKDAEAAAERWMPRMVPEQEVTLEDITVTASIRKLQFLDRTSLSLEIQTRAKDSGATRGLWPGWLGFDPTDGDDPDEATVTTRVSGFEPARPLASVAT